VLLHIKTERSGRQDCGSTRLDRDPRQDTVCLIEKLLFPSAAREHASGERVVSGITPLARWVVNTGAPRCSMSSLQRRAAWAVDSSCPR